MCPREHEHLHSIFIYCQKKKKNPNKWHIGLESLSLQRPSLQKTLRLANSFSRGIRGWRGWGSPSRPLPLNDRLRLDEALGRLINTRQMRYPTSESTNHCCSFASLRHGWDTSTESLVKLFNYKTTLCDGGCVCVKCVCLLVQVVSWSPPFPPILQGEE